ncbi:MAG: hypothetical protein QOG56_2306 [Solirubrobacteraceae bacterium]|nr:hypothetical protein [Solirubrobacteraceae bacterium]
MTARFAGAAIAAGSLAAMLLPGARAGAGIVLVAVALALAVALAGAVADRVRSGALGVLALALAASAAFRDAGWVVTGELVAAVALGSIATSVPRSGRATALAAVAALRLASGARRVAGAAVGALPATSARQAFALGRGLVLAGLLVSIFGALFAAGDRAFARVAGGLLPDVAALDDAPARIAAFALVTALAGALAQAARAADTPARAPLLRLGRSEWLTALGALNLLFALFVAVQVAVLFGGDGYVRDTAGVTYAQYARSGFAELVVVAVLTLAVVACALRWARTGDVRQARLLRALLGALCVLTLVVLASALHRLGLYEQAFGFTRTRLAAHAFLLLDAALFVLVVVALAAGRRDWLPRAVVVLCGLAALAFWAGDPDRRIAAHNLARYEATGRIDVGYLAQLSADAVPVLERLPARLRDDALAPQRERLARDDGFASANLARARARRALAR